MGGLATKCGDVTMDKSANAPKPLDASSTDSEEDDEEEDDEDEEEEPEGEDDTKTDAEAALQDGLKRGRTATFKQLINHSRDVGVDEEKILKAEAMLLAHKVQRRREAFEGEIREFLDGPDAEDLENCLQFQTKGEEYQVGDKVLDPLRNRIADLKNRQALNAEEVAEAKLWLEIRTRSFVKAAVKGRSTIWIDLNSGSKLRAVLVIDLIIKHFIVQKAGGDSAVLSSCSVDEVVPKRAFDLQAVASNEVFRRLSEMDQGNAVVLVKPDGPWLFVEESREKLDEMLAAVTVLSGAGLQEAQGKKSKGKKKGLGLARAGSMGGGDGKELSQITPRAVAPKKPPESEEDAADPPPEKEKEKKSKKEKKDKKDKKSKKKDGDD